MNSYHISIKSENQKLEFSLLNEQEHVHSKSTVIINGTRYSVLCNEKDLQIVNQIMLDAENSKIQSPSELKLTSSVIKLLNDSTSISDIGMEVLKLRTATISSNPASSSSMMPHDDLLLKTQDYTQKEPQLHQTSVLNQLHDQTGHGSENCGFHALKNGIAAQLLGTKFNALAMKLLTDQAYFLEFHKKYSKPLIDNSSDKDASIPILNQVIDRFLKDPNPSLKFAPFQKALMKNRDQIVLMNTSTSVDPAMAFLSEEGLKEGKKILEFSQKPPPSKITFIFGNESENHWFTIVAEKDSKGHLSFTCYDSFESNHARAGKDSPFYKATQSIQKLFAAPQHPIENAVFDIVESLERTVSRIGRDDENTLLDRTPRPDFADSSGDSGSQMETILRECIACYRAMKELEWISSSDIQKHNSISTIHELVAFYAKHTIDSEIMEIVSEIESGRDEKWLENLLDTEIHSIENHALFLPLNEQKEAMNVAELGKWLKKIYLEREQIATSAKVRERLKIEMSIEDEFSSDPVKEAERNIQLYIQTIQTGKKKDRLADVIKEAGTPACFTGRMGAISEFLPRLQWEELDQLAIAGYTFLTADVAISEFINSSIPREVEEDDEAAGKFINDFTAEKCLADVENFATQFETYCVGKNGKTFEEFLKREGITDSIPIKDWVAVSKNLIESKFFSEILSRAKTQAKRDFFI